MINTLLKHHQVHDEAGLGLEPCPTKRQGSATLRCHAHQVARAGTAWLFPPLNTAEEPAALENVCSALALPGGD